MPKYKIKILFLIKKRSFGYGKATVSYGLINSCQFVVDALKQYGIEAKIVQVHDNNCIDKEVREYKPTHVFVEALWVIPSKFDELFKYKYSRDAKWYIRLHSQTPFLGYEGIAFQWLKEYNELSKKYKNFHISSNSAMLVDDLEKALNIKMKYTPNIYQFEKKNHKANKSDTVEIGCFGAIRPFKNTLNQALAAIQFANKNKFKLKFHINASRFENMGESILKNLRSMFSATKHSLIEHDWANHEDFIKITKKMDICMQVSYTETFNIVLADAVSNNIPSIGSTAIEWLNPLYQADPNNVSDIAKKLDFAYYGAYLNLQRLNERGLNKHNEKAVEEWLELLD